MNIINIPIEPVATDWRKLYVVITGRTPLLLHDRLAMARAEEWRRANPREKAPPAEVEAEMGCIRDNLGVILVRSEAILESSKRGAKEVAVKPKLGGRTRAATREVSSSIMPKLDAFRLFRPPSDLETNPDKYLEQLVKMNSEFPDLETLRNAVAPLEPITSYRIDIRRVIVQRQGVMRARPLIELPWACVAEFECDAGLGMVGDTPFAAQLFHQALGYAGQIVGIGDYRPEKGGLFGKYAVVIAWMPSDS